MSMIAGFWNLPSKIKAIVEMDYQVLLIPVTLVQDWIHKYPSLNQLFYRQFNQRYDHLLMTIHQVLFNKMDQRLMDYLRNKSEALISPILDLRHHEIAKDPGTAREVVSRVLKKLETDGKIELQNHIIKIL